MTSYPVEFNGHIYQVEADSPEEAGEGIEATVGQPGYRPQTKEEIADWSKHFAISPEDQAHKAENFVEGVLPGAEAIENPKGINVADSMGGMIAGIPTMAARYASGRPDFPNPVSGAIQSGIDALKPYTGGWEGNIPIKSDASRDWDATHPSDATWYKILGNIAQFGVGTGAEEGAYKAATNAGKIAETVNQKAATLRALLDKGVSNLKEDIMTDPTINPSDPKWQKGINDLQNWVDTSIKQVQGFSPNKIDEGIALAKSEMSPRDLNSIDYTNITPEARTWRQAFSSDPTTRGLWNVLKSGATGTGIGAANEAGLEYANNQNADPTKMVNAGLSEAPFWMGGTALGELAPTVAAQTGRGLGGLIPEEVSKYGPSVAGLYEMLKGGGTIAGGMTTAGLELTKKVLHGLLSGTAGDYVGSALKTGGAVGAGDIYGTNTWGSPSNSQYRDSLGRLHDNQGNLLDDSGNPVNTSGGQ